MENNFLKCCNTAFTLPIQCYGRYVTYIYVTYSKMSHLKKGKRMRSSSYLVHMENKVKLTDILKAFVECFHKHLVNSENVM